MFSLRSFKLRSKSELEKVTKRTKIIVTRVHSKLEQKRRQRKRKKYGKCV